MNQITVIIPTYNRPEKLKLGLAAFALQSEKHFSVIIVDDGSSAENSRQYQEIISSLPFPCKLIRQENKGIAGATNTGISAARDGLLILTDDDIIPGPAFIESHRKHHEQFRDSILTGKVVFDIANAKTDVHRYKNFMDEKWIRVIFPGGQQLNKLTLKNFTLTAANLSFEKKLTGTTGLFDEKFRDCQDFEFGLRAYKKGISIYYDTKLLVHHNDPITLKYYAGRQKSYTRFRKKVLESYPELQAQMEQEELKNPGKRKNRIYDFLAKEQTIKFIENSALFKFLPRFIRYRVYGATIAALSRETL